MRPPEDRPINSLPRWQQTWRAFRELLHDYQWPTKFATVLLGVLAVLGTYTAAIEETAAERLGWPPFWVSLEKAMTSDAFLTFLALLVALFVGIAIKRRQLQGQLDGADHYTIGRALAYGYFKNFLVGALLVMEDRGSRLHVVKPRTVEDLRLLESEIWPQLEPDLNTRTEEVVDVARFGNKPLRRRILVISGLGDGAEAYYLDFPTTLFTVADYYASWNRWARRNNRPYIEPDRLPGYQQQQINDFFRHLRELVESQEGEEPVGVEALAEHGLRAEQLQALFRDRLVEISIDDLRQRLADRKTGLT